MTNEAGLEFEKSPETIYTMASAVYQKIGSFSNTIGIYMTTKPDGDTVRYIRADLAIPEGYALVPIEPTEEMRKAWNRSTDNSESYFSTNSWKAVIAVAQKGESK